MKWKWKQGVEQSFTLKLRCCECCSGGWGCDSDAAIWSLKLREKSRERGCYVSREMRNIKAKGYFEIDGKA
jgi:hypothetical protein